MEKFFGLIVVFGILAGCDKEAVQKLDARLISAEQRITELESRQKSVVNWILWKREQVYSSPNGTIFGYAPPQTLSAYPTRNECMSAVSRLVEPGGRSISADPVETDYGNKRVTFYCLPPGVQAGIGTGR